MLVRDDVPSGMSPSVLHHYSELPLTSPSWRQVSECYKTRTPSPGECHNTMEEHEGGSQGRRRAAKGCMISGESRSGCQNRSRSTEGEQCNTTREKRMV